MCSSNLPLHHLNLTHFTFHPFRYDIEVRGGHPSVLKRVLQHDLGASTPMVLMVSDIRTNAGRTAEKGQQQQQQQQGDEQEQQHERGGWRQQQQQGKGAGGESDGTGGAVQILGIQLTDGWYYINACVDEPLSQLLLTGRLQVRGLIDGGGCDWQLAIAWAARTDTIG